MTIDIDGAWNCYLARFGEKFGTKEPGTFAKFGNHMVQRLGRQGFGERLATYLRYHAESASIIGTGKTVSDALMLEFDESAAWLCLEAPNLMQIFEGKLGDIDEVVRRTSWRLPR